MIQRGTCQVAVPSLQSMHTTPTISDIQYYQGVLDFCRHQAPVVWSCAFQVYELEDQLSRAVRDRLEYTACVKDEGQRKIFSAALKPECPVCQTEAKGAILDPCRHLAACCSCANSLTR